MAGSQQNEYYEWMGMYHSLYDIQNGYYGWTGVDVVCRVDTIFGY